MQSRLLGADFFWKSPACQRCRLTALVQTLLSGKIRCNVIGNDVDVNEVEEVAPDIVGEVDEPLEDIDAYSTPLN